MKNKNNYLEDFSLFMEHFFAGNDKQTGKTTKLELFDYQKDIIKLILNEKKVAIIKNRQMGITLLLSWYVTWLLINKNEYRIGITLPNRASSAHFIMMVRNNLLKVQTEVEFDFFTENQNEIKLNNNSFIKASVYGEIKGQIFDTYIFDEADFIEKLEIKYINISMTMNSKEGNIILCTTPNISGKHEIKKIINNYFYTKYLKWTDNPIFMKDFYYKNNSNTNNKSMFDFSNVTSPWFEEQCKILNHNKNIIKIQLEGQFLTDEDLKQNIVNENTKSRVLTFRLESALERKLKDKIYELATKDISFTISDYIRNLIEKDLESKS